MRGARVLLVPAVLIGLAITVLVLETLAGSNDPEEPLARISSDGPLGPQEQAVLDFIAAEGDVCSLHFSIGNVDGYGPPPSLATRINNADLILLGRPTSNRLEPVEPPADWGRVLTTFEIDDSLKGVPSKTALLLDSSLSVIGHENLTLGSFSGFDACSASPTLVFLIESHRRGEWLVGGWMRLSGGDIAEVSPDLSLQYGNAEELLDGVRETVQQQEADGVPKGLLSCLERRPREDDGLRPAACPGDTFNPYQALQLATADGGWVIMIEPGPSPGASEFIRLEAGSPELDALVRALDLDVAVGARGMDPGDRIYFGANLDYETTGRLGFDFGYSPSAQTVRLGLYGGEFAAPPALQQAMTPFLAP